MNKNSPFINSCLCIDFVPSKEDMKKLPNINFIVNKNYGNLIKKYKNEWTLNRNIYSPLHAGQFVNYINYCDEDDDVIMFVDFDTTVQREPNNDEKKFFRKIKTENNMFYAQLEKNCSLLQHCLDINCMNLSENEIKGLLPNIENYKAFNVGFYCSNRKNILNAYRYYEKLYVDNIDYFKTHESTQILMLYVFQHYGNSLLECSVDMANAHWYEPFYDRYEIKNDQFYVDDKLVLFMHDKFEKDLKY
jgi:hypothetical protein